jgi:hypothetical protein
MGYFPGAVPLALGSMPNRLTQDGLLLRLLLLDRLLLAQAAWQIPVLLPVLLPEWGQRLS